MISPESLPKICVALGAADAANLRRLALDACDNGENFLELRLDLLKDPAEGVPVIRRILRRYPNTCVLVTCRRKAHGGAFTGTLEHQMELLGAAVDAGAQLVDIEIETAEAIPERVAALREKALLALSYHNFDRTPALTTVTRRMQKIPADFYKLAVMGRKPSDNLRALNLPASWPKKRIVVLTMGETGLPTRILGPSRRAAFVFASPDLKPPPGRRAARAAPPEPTAPGQIPASVLRNRYRIHKWTEATKIYGVAACPVAHSMSPVIHNRAFRSRRIDAVYVPFLVEATKLPDFFQVVEKLPLAGCSVTLPHKQKVLRHLDSADALARRIGAVNTVYRRSGKLCGTNTDAAGVVAPLQKRVPLNRASVLIVGNGGAARAAVFALADQGARVTLTGRNPKRVRALASACGVEWVEREKLAGCGFDVLVHATPAGMHPNVRSCFFDDVIPAGLVFDMVYNPVETELLKRARAQGKKTVSGVEMFVEQAAAQFEIWTRETAPRTAMRNSVLEALSETA